MSVADAVAAIEAGPKGSEIGAFFDFDGTLIDGYSAAPYFLERLRRREMSRSEAADIIHAAWHGDMNESEFAEVVGRGITAWAGRPEQELTELWSRLFREKIASRLFPEAWSLVKAHQRMGHTVAIATSATRYQAAPIAEELGIAHVLCTRAMVRDGRLTGGVEGTPLWGAGKAAGRARVRKRARGRACAEPRLCERQRRHRLPQDRGSRDRRQPQAGADRSGTARRLAGVALPASAATRPRRSPVASAPISRLARHRSAASPMPRRQARGAAPPNGSARVAATPCWR